MVECKHLLFKAETEMHVGGRAAWERGVPTPSGFPVTLFPYTVAL